MDSVISKGHRSWEITLDGNVFTSLKDAVEYLLSECVADDERDAMGFISELTDPPNVVPTYIDYLSEKD
jgi:hypothetical protein